MTDLNFSELWNRALPWAAYLHEQATADQRGRWIQTYESVTLSPPQTTLLAGFVRRMVLLCMSGAWCGDCVRQGPHLQRIAEACSVIDLRFVDRDAEPQLKAAWRICGGDRVPVVGFFAEDMAFCGLYGDRTLNYYRRMAATQLGPSCPTGIGPADPDANACTVADWLDEIERVQLMLRLSPRLRALHGD